MSHMLIGRNQMREFYKNLPGTITQLGRVPRVLGADFNQTPDEPLVGWFTKARVAAPDVPTHIFGRVLDWFLLSTELGSAGLVDPVHDTGIVGHTPVMLTLPAYGGVLGIFYAQLAKAHSCLHYVAYDADVLEPSWCHGIPTNMGDPRRVQLIAQILGKHESLGE